MPKEHDMWGTGTGEALELVRHCKKLPREVGGTPPLQVFRAGLGSEKHGLVKSAPAHDREVETRWSLRLFSSQTIL